ncbi:hypothetical protein ACTFIZ_003639 [Dictyostelium cf. discoideum]
MENKLDRCECNNTQMCPNTPIKKNIYLSTSQIIQNKNNKLGKFEDSEFYSIEFESLIIINSTFTDILKLNQDYYNHRKSIWESQMSSINERPSSLGIPLKF